MQAFINLYHWPSKNSFEIIEYKSLIEKKSPIGHTFILLNRSFYIYKREGSKIDLM